MGEKKIQTTVISSEVHIRFTQKKKTCILLCQVVQRVVKFEILEFSHFFSFSLTWEHMGLHVSIGISSESIHDICSKHSYILLGTVSTKVVKRIVKFKILIAFCWAV